MNWPPDVPDFPMKKPHVIEKIEKLPSTLLNAMTDVEIAERIRDGANGLAEAYFESRQDDGSLSECKIVVSSALIQTGSSVGGKLGTNMVATSDGASELACKRYYPERPFPNELEF